MKTVTILATVLFLVSLYATRDASGHLVRSVRDNRWYTVSLADARHFARMTHRFWTNKDRAHDAQEVADCESQLRRIERADQYWDTWQVSSGLRAGFGWGRTYRKQARATHAIYAASRREYGYGWWHWRLGRCA